MILSRLLPYFLMILLINEKLNAQAQRVPQQLDQEVKKMMAEHEYSHASMGICITEAKTGKPVYAYNSKQTLIPASTLKTLTTGAALGILGKQFTYQTILCYSGKINMETGELNGDIVVKGSGDPTLGSQYFRNKNDSDVVLKEFLTAIKNIGIKKINGKIIADNSCFENDLPGNWIWSDIGNYFGVSANGLSYHDNKFSIYFNSGSEGTSSQLLEKFPNEIELEFENHVTARGNGDNAFVYGSPGDKKRVITGTIPPNKKEYEVEAAMPDPSLYFARRFKNYLNENFIPVTGTSLVAKTENTLKEIKTYYSPALEKIITACNIKSNNHYAESLLKTLGLKKFGIGSTLNGIKAVEMFWKEKGINLNGLFFTDGSGLSRSNGITTELQTQILQIIYSDSTIFSSFFHSLPVSGISGSMTNIGKGTFAESNLHAKSGYIERVRAYCGYFKGKSSRDFCFSIILNNFNGSPSQAKLKLEKLMVLFCEL